MKITTIFSELLNIIPNHVLSRLTHAHSGDHYTKTFTTYQQLMVLLYSQIKGIDSLRDIEISLGQHKAKWYHLGFRGVKRSTLSDAMSKRSEQIFENLFYELFSRCRKHTPFKKQFRFKNPLYSLDSSVINLCMTMYPWAKFRRKKGALKLHCLLDHGGALPSFVHITEGRRHDVKAIRNNDLLLDTLKPDSIVCFDRAYLDFKWLNTLDGRDVYFVTRAKSNTKYRVLGQHRGITNKAIKKDIDIRHEMFDGKLRIVEFEDPKTGKRYEYLTNIMHLTAKTIADIYKQRWQIELFFKWIKQNLKIKSFLGTTENAVKTQIWVAMIYYLLLAYIKHQTRYSRTLTVLALILKEQLMEKLHLIDILSLSREKLKDARAPDYQLAFF